MFVAVYDRCPMDRVGKGNLKENLEPSKGLEGNLKEICREKSFDVAQRLSSRCVAARRHWQAGCYSPGTAARAGFSTLQYLAVSQFHFWKKQVFVRANFHPAE